MPKATNTKVATADILFGQTISGNETHLFRVNGGVPAESALYQAGAYLEAAREIIATMEDDNAIAFGVSNLIQLAESIVDAVAGGLHKEGGAA